MNFILYFLLRRFFVKLKISRSHIFLVKGLLLRQEISMPIKAVTKIEIRRTILLRILHGKRIDIHTFSGKITIYLGEKEQLPFLTAVHGASIRPSPAEIIAGAFTDTRAFSGVVLFSLTLTRIGGIFGGEYYDRIMQAITGTAHRITQTLETLHIYVPRVTAAIAVFTAAAWIFALVRKLAALARFRLCADRDTLIVRRGVFSLYECRIVRKNINAAVQSGALSSVILHSAPLYVHQTMIYPFLQQGSSERLCRSLCGIAPPAREKRSAAPPLSALLGHCAVPLGWLCFFTLGVILTYIAQHDLLPVSAPLLRSLLWIGVAASLWCTVFFGIYMLRSRLSEGSSALVICARKGARLQTAVIPHSMISYSRIDRNLFQLRNGLCDAVLAYHGKKRFKLRNAPYSSVTEIL